MKLSPGLQKGLTKRYLFFNIKKSLTRIVNLEQPRNAFIIVYSLIDLSYVVVGQEES